MYDVSVSFFTRGSRINKKGQVPVYCRITVNGTCTNFSTRRWVLPELWDSYKGRVKGSSLKAKEVNNHLTMLDNKIYTIHTELLNAGKPITSEILRNELLGKNNKQLMISDLFDRHNQMLKLRIGVDIVASTWKRYDTTCRHVMDFIRSHYHRKDVLVSELKRSFIRDFELYLKSHARMRHNSAVKYIRNLKKVVKWALENEWLTRDPFYGFSLPWQEEDCVFLEEPELQSIEEIELSSPRLDEVRDAFVFSCHTGLSYSDLKVLSRQDIQTDQNGYSWINTKRVKTNTKASIYLLPKALAIIDKYRNHPTCDMENVLLPLRSNQRYNRYLKELAEVCAIEKNLTTHVARHTCGTLLLNRDVPIETVSKMLGHKTIQQTQHYAKLLNKKVKRDMIDLEERMEE